MNKTVLIGTMVLSTISLTACGGGGSSSGGILPPAPTPTPQVAGCYGVNHTTDQYNGTSVFLSVFNCPAALAANADLSKFEPLTTVGNPPSGNR